jgi:hypothetical protein
VIRNWSRVAATGLAVTALLLAACGPNPAAAPVHPKPIDVNAVASQYTSMQQGFEQASTTIRARLAAAKTSDQVRAAYAAAAAAEHELNGKLLALPLFPTVIKADWKSLLMANRQLETVYTQLSLTPTAVDQELATQSLASARIALLRADTRFRNDLLLPITLDPIAP